MNSAPAVVVRGLADVRVALAPGRAVTLISAPSAALFAGCGWWRALMTAAMATWPGLVEADLLDCADAPGRALEAMRAGQRRIILAPCPGRADVEDAARARGATLLPARPPALDLADRRAAAGLVAWLDGKA